MMVRVVGLHTACLDLKRAAGWSSTYLAERVGVSRSTIDRWLYDTGNMVLIGGHTQSAIRTQLKSVRKFESVYASQLGWESGIAIHAC